MKSLLSLNFSCLLLLSLGLFLVAGCGSGSPNADFGDPSASTYHPTPLNLQEVGDRLVGPQIYTVDARSRDIWMYFDFSRNSVVSVQHPQTDDWDLAFQRHIIRTNGGDTNPSGQAAVVRLDEPDFAAVTRVPEDATFMPDVRTKRRLSSLNPALEKWYNYDYMANVLIPKPVVYIVRTQDGKYAKMRILSYYCKGGISGCLTFEYVYQGDGSTVLAPRSRVSRHLTTSR
jgi:hypothetical protein